MIGSLEGRLESKTKKFVLINVGGVGYKVFISPETLSKLPEIDSPVKLYTSLEVREDAQELYGFLTPEELTFYEMLRTVSGIGPKTALAILSLAPVQILASAIINKDTAFLTKVSGIGRKTAERVVLDLKDRVSELGFKETAVSKKDSDLIEALTKMGYGVRESAEALAAVEPTIEGEGARLKAALKILDKSRR